MSAMQLTGPSSSDGLQTFYIADFAYCFPFSPRFAFRPEKTSGVLRGNINATEIRAAWAIVSRKTSQDLSHEVNVTSEEVMQPV